VYPLFGQEFFEGDFSPGFAKGFQLVETFGLVQIVKVESCHGLNVKEKNH
jgi:hypothetical protein